MKTFTQFSACATRTTLCVMALVLAGCATQANLAPTTVAACDGINSLSDQAASARLDVPTSTLVTLRTIQQTDNAGVCATPNEKRAVLLGAYQKSLKKPNRAALRVPNREYLKSWDTDEFGNSPTSAAVLQADQTRRSMLVDTLEPSARTKAAGIAANRWEFIGPGNVGGRVRAMLIDPRNPNRLIVGAATGGIWISDNAGASFRAVADFMGNLAIGSLAMDPNNPNVIYAGTGETHSGLSGIGMFKSTDGGITWNFLPSTASDLVTAEWFFTNRIAVNQANSNVVLAATRLGVYRSVNAGASWVKTNAPIRDVYDVRFDPRNTNNALLASDDGFMYYSRDAGASWTKTSALVTTLTGRSTTARAEIAYAPTVTDLIYISLDNNKGDVWKSDDGGVTWTFLSNPKHLNDQGDYDNTIWVSPVDANHLVVGGLDVYRSMDAGASFTKISDWRLAGAGLPQPHADHHVLISPPNYSGANPVLYNGNDGGLFRSNDIFSAGATGTTSWVNLVNGLGVTQLYGGAGSRAAGGKLIGGTQDNGTIQYAQGTDWFRIAGGDGGFSAVDPVDDSTVYGEYVYASVHRSVGTGGRQYICTGITEALKNATDINYCGANNPEPAEANFIAPFRLDPNDRNRMLVGANSLWVSNNVKAFTPTWAVIKTPVAVATSRLFINAIEVFKRDSNVIWVGHNGGQVYKTSNGLSASPTWTRVGLNSAGLSIFPTSTINRITIDPDNSNRVWLSLTGFQANRIWQTDDGGANWRSISTTLPSVTVHDLKRHPTQTNWLYAATANGIYTSENSGTSWSATNDGPASVRVRELFFYDPATLVAATYGRGMWRIAVSGAGPADYSDLWWAGQSENGWGMAVNQKNQIQFVTFYVYDATGQPVWYVLSGGSWNANFTVYTGPVYLPTSAPFNNYNPAQFNVGAPVGNVSITYTSNTTATVQYVINGVAGQKSMQRFQFAPVDNTPGLNVGDIWWGGTSQNGWGVSITQQYRTLFAAWYTYRADGRATWYVMSGGTWSGNSYTGGLFSAQSSPWLGVPYNAAAFGVVPVGSVTFNFSDASNATMTYTVSGVTQSKAITRLPF